MKIVFRVDSGFHMGIGHAMRCLTLALRLKNNGHEIFFITKNHLGFSEKIISDCFKLFVIDGGVSSELTTQAKKNYLAWLGEGWEADLKKTNNLIDKIGKVDLVVIDHYSLDERYERQLSSKYVMVIDDLMNRGHSCDILLDQNITASHSVYKNLLKNESAVTLLGPENALLREEFEILHTKVTIGDESRAIKSILVFFGASDVNGDCLKVAKALPLSDWSNYEITFILNSSHRDFSELASQIRPFPKARLWSFVENLADLMLTSDLFIGAGGTTSWERACMGIATALVSVADNQTAICKELDKQKICLFLGSSLEMNEMRWRDFFREIVPNNSLWYNYRNQSYKLVDGLGAKRVTLAVEKILNVKN